MLHVLCRPPHPLWLPENVTGVVCRCLCTDVNTKVSGSITPPPRFSDPSAPVQLRYIQVDRSAGFASGFRMHSEGGVPSSPALSYLYCTPSLSSVDSTSVDPILALDRMQIRGTSRLRTHCRLRSWISGTSSVLNLLPGSFPQLINHIPTLSSFRCGTQGSEANTGPNDALCHPKDSATAAVPPLTLETNLFICPFSCLHSLGIFVSLTLDSWLVYVLFLGSFVGRFVF